MNFRQPGEPADKPSDPHSCAGRTLVEIMEDELLTVVDRLMSDAAAADGRDPGRAEGIAYCIAIIKNPYRPNIDAVREAVMKRWEAMIGEG